MPTFPVQASPPMSRLGAALIAGAVAIVLNTLALKAADLVHLETAHGGLLRLLTSLLSGPLALRRVLLVVGPEWAGTERRPVPDRLYSRPRKAQRRIRAGAYS